MCPLQQPPPPVTTTSNGFTGLVGANLELINVHHFPTIVWFQYAGSVNVAGYSGMVLVRTFQLLCSLLCCCTSWLWLFFVENQNLVHLLLLAVYFCSEKPLKIHKLACLPQWSELKPSALLHSCHGHLPAPLHSASTASTANDLQHHLSASFLTAIHLNYS